MAAPGGRRQRGRRAGVSVGVWRDQDDERLQTRAGSCGSPSSWRAERGPRLPITAGSRGVQGEGRTAGYGRRFTRAARQRARGAALAGKHVRTRSSRRRNLMSSLQLLIVGVPLDVRRPDDPRTDVESS
jgi:hypothetical protein